MSIFNDFELLDFIDLDEMQWGTDAPAAYSLVASAGTFSTSGSAVTFAKQSILSLSPGAVSVSGQAVALRAGHEIGALAGEFSAVGITANLAHRSPARPGSVLVAGAASGLSKTHILAVDSGAIAVAGQRATVGRITTLPGAAATVDVTGTPAKTLHGRTVLSDGASYDVEGVAALLRATRKMAAAGKNLALNGSPVALKPIRTLIAASGGLNLTGQSAEKIRSFRLAGVPGSVQVMGRAVSLASTGNLDAVSGEVSVTGHGAKLGLYFFRNMPSAPGAYETATYAALLKHASRLVASAASVQLIAAGAGGKYHEIAYLHPANVSPHGVEDLRMTPVGESAPRVIEVPPETLTVTRVSATAQTVISLQ